MTELLQEIHRAAAIYRRLIEDAGSPSGSMDRRALFAYRVSTMESEVMKPLAMHLLDLDLPAIPEEQLNRAFDVVESWLVRRMLVRATTKSYTQVVSELITLLMEGPRELAGDLLSEHLRKQTGASRYWPDDTEVAESLSTLPVYRRLSRRRLRMLLEAIEDHLRGWHGTAKAIGGERVDRGKLAIEHVLPRKWQRTWPLEDGVSETERERLLHTLGNLTLLTSRLNSSLSNRPWIHPEGGGKRAILEQSDVLMLNRRLLQEADRQWNESLIRARTKALTGTVLEIWSVPPGHRSNAGQAATVAKQSVDLLDLLSVGLLRPGATLYARRSKHRGRTATVLQDGQIDVDGTIFQTPTGAARSISPTARSGWRFFAVDPERKRTLRDVSLDYLEQVESDLQIDEDDDDEEGD